MTAASFSDTFVGIDLGTTFCRVSIFKNGKPQVLKFNEKYEFPSMVLYGITNQYGFQAQSNISKCPKNVIYDSKRMLGKTYNDLSNEIPKYMFDIEPDEDGNPIIPINIGERKYAIKPYEVSASILNYIREFLEERNIPLDHVAVSVPAHFNQKQLDDIRKALQIAEYPNPKKIFLFKETTATALCILNSISLEKETTILVYDFGGGKFDISLFKVSSDQINVIAHDGDSHLGGRDIDYDIVNHIIKIFNQCRPDIAIDKYKGILIEEAEKAKIRFSNSDKTVKIGLSISGKQFECILYKETLESIINPYIQRTIKITKNLMERHKNINPECIYIVGGTSKIPYVKKVLKNEFTQLKIKELNSANPFDNVAIGLAQKSFSEFLRLHNGVGNIISKSLPNKIIESVSVSYGYISYHGDEDHPFFMEMIKKDTKLPSEPITSITSTMYDNQKNFLIQIMQGNTLEDAKEIGRYVIYGLYGNKKAGEEKAKITFQVDEQNCLHAKFHLLDIEGANEESMDIELENSLAKISKEQIKESRERIGVNAK